MTKASVLIVDDEPDALLALSMALQPLCYDVSTAKDGLDALQVVAQHRPHVIDLLLLSSRRAVVKAT
jgi:CheY-like chemotaxis protein